MTPYAIVALSIGGLVVYLGGLVLTLGVLRHMDAFRQSYDSGDGSRVSFALVWWATVPLAAVLAPVGFLIVKLLVPALEFVGTKAIVPALEFFDSTATRLEKRLDKAKHARERRQETRAASKELPRAVAKERK